MYCAFHTLNPDIFTYGRIRTGLVLPRVISPDRFTVGKTPGEVYRHTPLFLLTWRIRTGLNFPVVMTLPLVPPLN